MTVKKALPILWKYLAIVMASCACAFVISSLAKAESLPAIEQSVAATYTVTEAVWTDGARSRDVPVRVLVPATSRGADSKKKLLPVVLFSHGLGGSRMAGKLWAEHWASHGFIVVQLQHLGSDEKLWKDKAPAAAVNDMKAGMTMTNLGLRVQDVRFVLDEMERRKKSGDATFSRADLTRIGMSGHSFGAQTTLALSGQRSGAIGGQTGLDARIKSAIALSPNARNKIAMDKQFGDIRIPFMSITGSEDGAVLGDGTVYTDRKLPYAHMPSGDKYLLVFEGGDHMIFGGQAVRGVRRDRARDEEIQADLKAATLAFWQATLDGDLKAREWLAGGIKTILVANDSYEAK